MSENGGSRRFLRRVLGLAVVLGLLLVAGAAFANWRRDGVFSLRLLDPAWWGAGTQDARKAADDVHARVWGPGGVVERAERWVRERRSGEVQQGATRSAETLAIEERIAAVEASFAEGAQRLRDAEHGAGDARAAALGAARERFARVERDLAVLLPAYQARPDHEPERLARLQRMRSIAGELLSGEAAPRAGR